MVYSLSNAGINVNKKNSKGNTALHIACMRGYVEINNLFFEVCFYFFERLNYFLLNICVN